MIAMPDDLHPDEDVPPAENIPAGPNSTAHINTKSGEQPTNPSGPTSKPPDPFDPASLRLGPELVAASGVKKHLVTIPVKKPSKEWFVRTHEDPNYRLETCVIELKEDNETYLVSRDLWDHLSCESTFSPRLLVTAINKQNTVFIWPIRLPGPDGRDNEWNKSALEAVKIASKSWTRVQSNMNLGAYDVIEATGDFGRPQWPDLPFNELLRIAFKDHFINSPDHPVLKKLRGDV